MQTKTDQPTNEGNNEMVEVNITEMNDELKMHANNSSSDCMGATDNTEKPSADAILIRYVFLWYLNIIKFLKKELELEI